MKLKYQISRGTKLIKLTAVNTTQLQIFWETLCSKIARQTLSFSQTGNSWKWLRAWLGAEWVQSKTRDSQLPTTNISPISVQKTFNIYSYDWREQSLWWHYAKFAVASQWVWVHGPTMRLWYWATIHSESTGESWPQWCWKHFGSGLVWLGAEWVLSKTRDSQLPTTNISRISIQNNLQHL